MATDDQEEIFGISAVSRLTGISTHALRVWERRYGVVEPGRSDSKRREYTREEIRRLTLLKTLVDYGHAIRNVAPLTTEQLEQRLRETSATDSLQGESDLSQSQTCRVAFAGAIAREALKEAADSSDAIRLVGDFGDLENLKNSLQRGSVDLLIAEFPHFFPDALDEIQEAVAGVGARRAIVIYRFAASETVASLDGAVRNLIALRAPVDAAELKLACLADIAVPVSDPSAAGGRTGALPDATGSDGIPARQFSEDQLAKIARHATAIKCECPQHLANLLSDLGAFEDYSEACENRSEEDAKLHAYLHRETARCRAMMEEALRHLLAVEKIQIDD